MTLIPARELRNHTAEVIERARNGEDVVITVNGVPTAKLVPIRVPQKLSLTKAEFLSLRPAQPDLTLAADIAALASDTTDDLGPIR